MLYYRSIRVLRRHELVLAVGDDAEQDVGPFNVPSSRLGTEALVPRVLQVYSSFRSMCVPHTASPTEDPWGRRFTGPWNQAVLQSRYRLRYVDVVIRYQAAHCRSTDLSFARNAVRPVRRSPGRRLNSSSNVCSTCPLFINCRTAGALFLLGGVASGAYGDTQPSIFMAQEAGLILIVSSSALKFGPTW